MRLGKYTYFTTVTSVALTGCTASISPSQFFYRDPPERASTNTSDTDFEFADFECGKLSYTVLNSGNGTGTLVYYGGNQFRLSEDLSNLKKVLPFSGIRTAVAFDYPGRGLTTGDITPECFVSASIEAARIAQKLRMKSEPLIGHGFSFGGMMVPQVASKIVFDNLILESTAASPEDWLRAMAPPGIKVRVDPSLDKFRSIEALENSDAKILVITGTEDASAGPKVAQKLSDALEAKNKTVQLLIVPGAKHGEVFFKPSAIAKLRQLAVGKQ